MWSHLFLALGHQVSNNTIAVHNSLIIGDISRDCSDVQDTTTLSETWGKKVIPHVSGTGVGGAPDGRVGISFPYFSGDNMIPKHPWTGIGTYPASKWIEHWSHQFEHGVFCSRWYHDFVQFDIRLFLRCVFTSRYCYLSLAIEWWWSTSNCLESSIRLQFIKFEYHFQRTT